MVGGCSNFMLSNEYQLSVRTMDLGGDSISWIVMTSPTGITLQGRNAGVTKQTSSKGFVAVVPQVGGVNAAAMSLAGINEAGVTCDSQTLITTEYAKPTNTAADLEASYFCQWVLGTFNNVDQVRESILNRSTIIHADTLTTNQHWSVRDAGGQSIVVEWSNGVGNVYTDGNDGGKTGFGIMTNEPEYPWQVQNVKHYMWKQALARPATTMPGTFYPDERFLRIHLVKEALPKPTTHPEAMMQAVHVLNTITVPMGAQMGTDSGAGEGQGDHTQFGIVYDHLNSTMYFRSQTNQNLQRLALKELSLQHGAQQQYLPVENSLPWFVDAAPALKPTAPAARTPLPAVDGWTQEDCVFTSPAGREWDFTESVEPSDLLIPGDASRGFIFYYNFCKGVESRASVDGPGCTAGVDAACQRDVAGTNTEHFSLGKLSTVKLIDHGARGVTLTYQNGSSLYEPDARPRDINVNLWCDPDATTLGPAVYASKWHVEMNISLPAGCPRTVPPPPATTCAQVLYRDPAAVDGEFQLHCPLAGVTFSAYCYGMKTGSPKEYLTLPRGPEHNFASYLCGKYCKSAGAGYSTLLTSFTKVRINPCRLTIDILDFTFSKSTGKVRQELGNVDKTRAPVGTAAACEANQGSSSSGLGSLDFGGTPFVIKSGWKLAGNAVFGSHVFSASRGSVRLEGGGYCGGIEPDAFNEWAPEPTRWSIELEAASTAAGTPKLKWLHRKNE
eukprot:gene9787-32289_t